MEQGEAQDARIMLPRLVEPWLNADDVRVIEDPRIDRG
jgi:hypothetical protein